MTEQKLIRSQSVFSAVPGSFGPLGNVRANGCGAIALYNVLRLLGYTVEYGELLREMRMHWPRATLLGGILGSNPFYLLGLLRRKKGLALTFYGVRNRADAGRVAKCHDVYLNLYLYRWGAHYTAAVYRKQGLFVCNDPSTVDYGAYFEQVKARFMVVVGIDRHRRISRSGSFLLGTGRR